MRLPSDVAGRDAREMRDLFRKFIDGGQGGSGGNGVQSAAARRFDTAWVCAQLNMTEEVARSLVESLVEEGYLKERLVPAVKGMALAAHIDRDPITRAEADRIIDDLIAWATKLEATGQRIRVKSLEIFGSYLTNADTLGDIDVVVIFTTHDLMLSGDLQFEDLEREEELADEIASLSEYISPARLWDRLTLASEEFRLIFGHYVPDPVLEEELDQPYQAGAGES
jgi:predicted nucleotidyltransferase